jgi:hypothetical protein
VVVKVLLEVFQVIGVAHMMVMMMMVKMRLLMEDVVSQMRFDVVRMQDGPRRYVVVVMMMRRGRRRSGS